MFDFLKLAILPNNRNNIKAEIAIKTAVFDIMVGSHLQIPDFPVVYRRFRISKHPVAPCLDFCKDQHRAIKSNNIQVAMTRLPVSFQYHISFTPEIIFCALFAPDSQFIMRCHTIAFCFSYNEESQRILFHLAENYFRKLIFSSRQPSRGADKSHDTT